MSSGVQATIGSNTGSWGGFGFQEQVDKQADIRVKGHHAFKALNPRILANQSMPHISCHLLSSSYESK